MPEQKTEQKKEKKGAVKTIWQVVKFALVSGIVSIIQIVLAYLLPFIFDGITATLPGFLAAIFNPDVIFDASTADGLASLAKYAPTGVVTWGYVLPFLLSNLIANIYGYFQNRKTTFKSDTPTKNVVIYLVILLALILFTTWIQGLVYGACTRVDSSFIHGIARLLATGAAGMIQFIVIFPLEKFWLLKEKKTDAESGDSAAEAVAEAATEEATTAE
ncbi:MAG TPA: hypothetical protein PLS28_00500 [Clostridiales bacterium]|nr:hypothetical protein [Clostridiales bacterium]